MNTQAFDYGTAKRSGDTHEDGWLTHIRAAVVSTIVLAVLFGGVYTLVVWGISRLPGLRDKAEGSLIVRDGKVLGSSLLGQTFTGPGYFHPRPSAAGSGYDAAASSGTNLGPTSSKLLDGIKDDPASTDKDESFAGIPDLVAAYRQENGLSPGTPVPADAVTRSASGLDPHISLRNAELQVARVARERKLPEDQIRKLVQEHTDAPSFGLLGESGVNVTTLNLALYDLAAAGAKK